MPRLPPRFAAAILTFAPLFSHRSWRHAEVLLVGAILAPGKRTVTSLLRIGGLAQERRFVNHHRVLNRAAWSPRAASHPLLGLLLDAFAPRGPVVPGLDDTIERRRGKRTAAKGIHRDPVRSSHGHFVKASGLRWLSLMLLVPLPWAGRVWALPFLTALAPSERYCRERGRRRKRLADRARQLVLQARRWMPERGMVLVADGGFAALELLAALRRHGVSCITRLRLDAALYDPAPLRLPGTTAAPGPRAPLARRTCPTCWPIPPRAGNAWWCRAGTAKASAPSNSARPSPRGAMAGCPSWRYAGCWRAIPSAGSTRGRCCAPTPTVLPSGSCAGSFNAGSWR